MVTERSNQSVYERVVHITHIYLGPAADRFIDRQIQNHLHKAPEALVLSDIAVLTDWIRIAVAMLTDDAEIVEEYIMQLQRIAESPKKRQGSTSRAKRS